MPIFLPSLRSRPGIRARQLQRSLPRFGAGVAEEDAVQAGDLGEAQRKLGLAVVEEEIRDVQQLPALFADRLLDRRMPVAQRVDADAAQQVEIAVSLVVDQVHAFAADKQDGIALVGLEQQLRFSRLHGRQCAASSSVFIPLFWSCDHHLRSVRDRSTAASRAVDELPPREECVRASRRAAAPRGRR